MAARLANSLADSSSLSSKVRPSMRSTDSTPMTIPPTVSGTMIEACGSASVPGTTYARIARHVVHELRFVVTHDPAADADVERGAPVLDVVGVAVAGVSAVELVGLGVDQADLHAVVVDHALDQRGDAREDVVVVERGKQGSAQLQNDLAQLDLRGEQLAGAFESVRTGARSE